uniref:Uncharacterized protein n=1 Tax=Zooxanthella nutricula TaxID=1333877 RepID=A0A6U6GHB4_9DINO|mmetsp:Transcript_103493/g.316842  ORF Transcript_103493/g.316842 Transcript_103493/m.316842 type:complete len:213 (+) Transcript_103493:75-713(+)|eukprot:CAMPEP_0198507596 /NCGR_PEP_ID=MMETSP1462-20131121/12424_1 /TAXON_ID=1333877 /ORGANISM="Brandtodinium nutriculum, Strain RCC3387" /LENGTH=212 /DNA_ID=CAMNT_0044236847 /DNA_START=75 /DNA_END=713 /DNA_ORIENTATION=-
MPGSWALHILDMKLAREWFDTSKEYFGFVRRPFQPIPPRDLLKFRQSSWVDAFREWGVLQFYLGCLNALVGLLTGLVHGENLFATVVSFVLEVVFAYLIAHLGWFAVVHKNGCFCCLVACCEAPVLLLLWGLLAIIWGICALAYSVAGLGAMVDGVCGLCIVRVIVSALYAVVLAYTGLCCIKIWGQRGSETVPPAVEVKGPEGEVVGAVQV